MATDSIRNRRCVLCRNRNILLQRAGPIAARIVLIRTSSRVTFTDLAIAANLMNPFNSDPLAEYTLIAHVASEFYYRADPFMARDMNIHGMGARYIVDIRVTA